MAASVASSAAYQNIGAQNLQAALELQQEYFVNATLLLTSLSYLTPDWPDNAIVADGQSFDFIVVGGGGAGCIVASRLSENPNWNVLLIEAGGDPPLGGVVPGGNFFVVQTMYDYNYTSTYPPEHLQSKTVPGFTSAGKMLGGSSGNMYMEYIRGSRADYDAWGELFPEWNYESVLPYFKKFEGLQNDEILNDPVLAPYHNSEGPIKVSQTKFPPNIQEKLGTYIEMFGELGIPHNIDYNGPDMIGATQEFFFYSKPEPNSLRYGSAYAYLVPAGSRKNLFVLKNAYATRLIIKNKVAKGVEVLINGKTSKFYAKKEVIVSAGIAGSTKLLVASGIGAAADLSRLNIDVVADLPVGYNLEDHVAVLIVVAGHHDLRTNIELRQPLITMDSLPGGTIKVFHSFSGADTPDTAMTNFYFTVNNPVFLGLCATGLAFNYNIDICKLANEANLIHELWVGEILLSHPKSKGQILVPSVAPEINPIFDNNYFSDEDGEDMDIMRKSLRLFASLTETTYFKNQSFVVDLGLPACGTFDLTSDEYLNCYINSLMHSALTYTGTQAMGKVVDVNMKVYGVENLRTVDAGVIPIIPSGHTFAAVAMLSEKISDVIKAEYGYTASTASATTVPTTFATTPAKSATTTTPAKSATTTTPAKSATTTTPAKSASTTTPAKTATTTTPAQSSTTTSPAKPATTTKPAKTATSITPTKSATTTTPTKSGTTTPAATPTASQPTKPKAKKGLLGSVIGLL